jgi:hypothetical protein
MSRRRRRATRGEPGAKDAPDAEAAAEAFVAGLEARGEVGAPDADGELPPGATHETVEGEGADGDPGHGEGAPAAKPAVRRRRFSAY